MKINTSKLTLESFPGDLQEAMSPLVQQFNSLVTELSYINTNNVTMENLAQEIIEIKLVNEAFNFPVNKKLKLNKLPKGIHCIYALATDGTQASNTPWLTYTVTNGMLNIESITNLTASKTYTLRILVIYE